MVDHADATAARFVGVAAEPGSAKPDPIIVVDNISRAFGGLKAVDVAHLEIQRGAITGLIGPNGAGKTTFFNLLTGFERADGGTWSLDGANMSRLHPHQVARRGVVRTFQLTKALAKMSVLDNVKLGATHQAGERILNSLLHFRWRKQEAEITERAHEMLARFRLDAKADDMAGSLSGGQRKLLEMARALMTDPKVVMLDEPMAGVNPALTENLLAHISSLRDQGMTVVFVEHDMDVIRDISDWVVVMAQGSIIAESLPEALGDNTAVVDAYLGSHHDQVLEFDADGNPVGATAVLAEQIEQAVAETIEAGGDPSQAEIPGGPSRP
ncbi:ABC transporter ATP-binding protein [Mycolicibacterium duvalii]|uniref:ABC transporter ATP-binding protein n=1 Tax=Mycolicibacterium duvalii TaxID=39688 RepID=A0A7I7JXN0_9MYCO|nr:ABC transporter ATP-binding protein [Mycolicibacterium duvalii]MCV7366891.1 ABC transporter ATP-binding protein [Mycolicibacterium duvalii]PEG44002.1 ABC transporter ATP-binding protein [Mycolicibacterium duvalii]BBX16646.1 ABC transporter ATP-binding protein [Mycolicibacterium duvalii]